jgi:hypothetical protein
MEADADHYYILLAPLYRCGVVRAKPSKVLIATAHKSGDAPEGVVVAI